MSRAHMLYDDTVMSALPVKITRWNGTWNPDLIFKRRFAIRFNKEVKIINKKKFKLLLFAMLTSLNNICLPYSEKLLKKVKIFEII